MTTSTLLPVDEARWRALGCTAHLVVTDPAQLDACLAAAREVVDAVDLAASRFRPDSEISRLNAARGERVPASPLFAELLAVALEAARWTRGAVDPTVGRSLLDLGYDRTFTTVPADGPPITVVLRPAVGWQTIELRVAQAGAAATVRIPDGVLLDLGATAKGHAADLAARAAAEAGGCGVLVSLGGDVAVSGPTPAGGWPVLVTDTTTDETPVTPVGDEGQVVLVPAGGVATSGTSSRRWRRGGALIHHLIDPRSGGPAAGPWRTVSVVAVTCADANAASTGAMVMGDTGAAWLVEQGMAARLVRHDGSVVRVGGWPAPLEGSVV